MWSKVGEIVLKVLGVPLMEKVLKWIADYFKRKKEAKELKKSIDKRTQGYEDSKTSGEAGDRFNRLP